MKKLSSLCLFFISAACFANTDLHQQMANTCENLGSAQGEKCVILQRKFEKENVSIDSNGASLCALIWTWGSRGGDTQKTGDLVLSCFNEVANKRISDEVKQTCNKSVYEAQGSIASISTVTLKVNKMMSCIHKLSKPSGQSNSPAS